MRKDIKEIRQVLKDYSRIKHDLKQVSFLPSPRFDAVSSHSNSNHTESKFIYHADLSWQLHRVEDAIDNIKDSKYRFIIKNYIIRSIKNTPVLKCANAMGLVYVVLTA